MKNLMYLFLITLFSWNCSADLGNIDTEQSEEVLSCSYTIKATSISLDSIYTLKGTEISWSPDIGYLGLGPEKNIAVNNPAPRGSLFMSVTPGKDSLWRNVSVLDKEHINLFTFRFFSILFPQNPIETAEANFYSLKTMDSDGGNISSYFLGEDSKFELVNGAIRAKNLVLEMKREIINEKDMEEHIVIIVEFEALEICN